MFKLDRCCKSVAITVDGTPWSTVEAGNSTLSALTQICKQSSLKRASKELKAFWRVGVKPGETKTVKVDIPFKDLE